MLEQGKGECDQTFEKQTYPHLIYIATIMMNIWFLVVKNSWVNMKMRGGGGGEGKEE